MAALANVLLSTILTSPGVTSDAAIGIDKTYAPEGWKPGNVAAWVDRSGGIPLLYPRLLFSLRPPTPQSDIYKVSTKLFYPVAETIDPAVGIFGPRKAYEMQFHGDVLLPGRCTSAERSAFFSLIRSLMCNTITASDGTPSDTVGSPMRAGVLSLEDVY
jgi:hypothetical protein